MRTKRLHLRGLRPDDAPRIAELAGVWEVASMTGRVPYPYSADAAQEWITGLADGEIVFGIEHDGALIGVAGYTPNGDGEAEFGYWIGQPYWKQGFATEAARRIMDYGFTEGRVKRFYCAHFTENPASRRVIEKLGFTFIGHAAGWCAARGMELPALRYERKRPLAATLRSFAS